LPAGKHTQSGLGGISYGEMAVIMAYGETGRKQPKSESNPNAHCPQLLLALNQAAQAVQRSHTPEEVYRIVGQEMVKLGFHAVILELTADRKSLILQYLTLEPAQLKEAAKLAGVSTEQLRISLETGGFFSRILKENKAVYAAKAQETVCEALPDATRQSTSQILSILGFRQGIYIPLIIGGRVEGLLLIVGANLIREDIPAVTLFANQMCIAIENSRRYQTSQNHSLELEERIEERTTALRASEKHFRALIENSAEAISLVDAKGTVLYDSPSYEKILGYRPDDRRGKVTFDLVHPDDREPLLKLFEELLQKKDQVVLPPVRVRHADGSWRWIEGTAQNLLTEPGVGAIVINFHDITERKRMDQAICLMSDAQHQIARMTDPAEIYSLVGERIHEIIGDGYVAISTLDEQLEAMRLIGLFGFGDLYRNLVRTFKVDPLKMIFYLKDRTDEELGLFRSGILENMKGGLYQVLSRKVPKTICDAAEKELRITDIYTMGFVWKDLHSGSLFILAKGDLAPYRDIIETIVTQAAISLQRIRSETELRRSEELLREAQRVAHIGSWVWNVPNDRLEWSEEMFRIFGIEKEKATGKLIDIVSRVIHPEDRAALEKANFLSGEGKPAPLEYRVIRSDGSMRVVRSETGMVIRDGDGKPAVITGIAQDITERKLAESALRESEARFSKVFHASPGNTAIVRLRDNIIIDVNEAWQHMTGYTREEAVGHSPLELGIWVNPSQREKYVQLLVKNSAVDGFEHQLRSKTGKIHNVLVFAEMIELAGEPCMLSMSLDITQRKEAEEALQSSEERLRSVLQTASDAILMVDSDIQIRFWNNAAESMFGYASDQVIGKPLTMLIPERFHGQFRLQLHPKATTGQLVLSGKPMEIMGVCKDGSEFPAEISLSSWKIREGGYFTAIFRNISERRRAEEEKQRRLQELEGINRVSTALRTAQSLEEMLPILLKETLALLNSDAGAIWLYDPAKDILQQTVSSGWFFDLKKKTVGPGEGIPGAVLQTKKTRLFADFSNDPALRENVSNGQIPAGWGGACLLIRATQETIGVLCISVRLPRQLTPEELNLLATVSEIAGNAINRTRLFEQTKRQLKRLASLNAIDNAITTSLNLKVTLSFLLDQVTGQLQADASCVLLRNSETMFLEYAADRGFRGRAITSTRLRLGEGQAGTAAYENRLIHIPDLNDTPLTHPERIAGEEFVSYFAVPLTSKGKVKGILEIFFRTSFTPDPEWSSFLDVLARQAAIAIDNTELFNDLQTANLKLALAYDATLDGWSRAMDLRDRETEGHSQRVMEITLDIAHQMGMSGEELIHIRRGALLHDVGKLGVPDEILLKPDKLTDEEMAVMRRHPMLAYEMLMPIEYLRPSLDIPYCHHEKWDGSGYPRGLKGEQIPLAARIFSIVDVYDALSSDRPYRKAWPQEKVLSYIRERSGMDFEPRIVEMFLQVIGKYTRE
jgi:PAS domain S-box-containing protein